MSVVLLRIDERLIHGQVVIGWGQHLHPDRIVVVDDALAESAWERELYLIGVPDEMKVEFVPVDHARNSLPEWHRSDARTIVLVRDVDTLRRLAEDGLLRGWQVNLGGVHHAAGRSLVLPYVFLSDDERAVLDELAAQGVKISARDVPGARRVPIEHLTVRDG